MPSTIMMGSQGTDVMLAQGQLNLGPTRLQHLSLDGIFGAKTKARTLEFQRDLKLTVDGIIGPKTWAELGKLGRDISPPRLIHCGNGDPNNDVRSAQQKRAFDGGAIQKPTATNLTSRGTVAGPNPMTIGGQAVTTLIGSKFEALIRSTYQQSLHYDRIFLSGLTGIQNRPFTVSVAVPPLVVDSLPFGGFVQIMNIGATQKDHTMIHEAGHVWQSQHHFAGPAFMVNCIRCQAAALNANLAAALIDPNVRKHDDFPSDFPFSAYAYRPGNTFGSYGGEQIAQQIERKEAAIVSHVVSKPAGSTDLANVGSVGPDHIRTEDRRSAGVLI